MKPTTSQVVRAALVTGAVSSILSVSVHSSQSAPIKSMASPAKERIALKTTHARVAFGTSTPASEVRGMWVVRTSITTPQSIARVVSQAKAHNFNTLFVQVRGRGDAFYESTLEPRSEELTGQPLSFDPLQETIDQAHAAGIQVHAWINTCFVWGSPHLPISPEHVVNAHPDWLDRDPEGHSRMTTGADCEGAFLSPANLDARKHIHDVYLEIATKYDVDGMHFDYIRYPNLTYDYSRAMVSRFQDEITPKLSASECQAFDLRLRKDRLAYVHAFPIQFADFRRRQVTEMVRDISHDIKAAKPNMVMSAAVFADSKDAYKVRGQDWKTWLREGYLDAVVPMAYGKDTAKVAAQIADAVNCARESNRYVYAGIGAWHIPAASTIAKIAASRKLGANGEVLFSYGGVTKDGASEGYLDKVAGTCYASPASVPQMAWMAPKPETTAANRPAADPEAGQGG